MNRPRRALISTFDKRGVEEFAGGLVALGFEIVSTGGTAERLANAGIAVTPVAEATGSAEILDGRVKTLHPVVHAGILARRDDREHLDELQRRGIAPIDVVAGNLYPFAQTVAAGHDREMCLEMIDIGGPTMIRAAAKNHADVWVVVDPDDYERVLETMVEGGKPGRRLRQDLASKAFDHTAAYDRQIADWMGHSDGASAPPFPARFDLTLEREMEPRYGENPHQTATVYRFPGDRLFGGCQQHQGKQLSYNNLLDLDAARSLASCFEEAAVAIVKHNNPCGVGVGQDATEAYEGALACDPLSAFGSVVGVNRAVDAGLAGALRGLFVEVIVAPAFEQEALQSLREKTTLRLIEAPLRSPGGVEYRSIDGGLLAQERDQIVDDPDAWQLVSERGPDDKEMQALALAWTVCGAVRSNAIVIANPVQTVGIGAGQMSRVDACRLAVDKAKLELSGTAAASDAFFPFADGVQALASAGVTAIVQPGGSKRDGEVIATADHLGLAMLMTGRRHFRH